MLPVHSLTVDGKHFCCITSGSADERLIETWGSKHQGMSTSTRYIDHQGNSAPSWGPERMYVRGEWDPKLLASWGCKVFWLFCKSNSECSCESMIAILHSFCDCSCESFDDCSFAFILWFLQIIWWLLFCIHFMIAFANHLMIALLHSFFCDCICKSDSDCLQFRGELFQGELADQRWRSISPSV